MSGSIFSDPVIEISSTIQMCPDCFSRLSLRISLESKNVYFSSVTRCFIPEQLDVLFQRKGVSYSRAAGCLIP